MKDSMNKKMIVCALIFAGLFGGTISQAALVWIGSADSQNVLNESNYTNTVGLVGAIAKDVPLDTYTGGVVYSDDTLSTPKLIGDSTFILGDNDMVIDGIEFFAASDSTITGSKSLSLLNGANVTSGFIQGFSSITVTDSTLFSEKKLNNPDAASAVVNISGTSSVEATVVADFSVNLSDSAELKLRGGVPINGSTINFASDSTGFLWLTDKNSEETTGYLSQFKVDGDEAVVDGNIQILSDGGTGSYVSVIPEPATLGLVAIFGGGLLLVRRISMM